MNFELSKLSTKEHFALIKNINEKYLYLVFVGLIKNGEIFDLKEGYFTIGGGGYDDELIDECLGKIEFDLKDGYYELHILLQYQEAQRGENYRVEIPSYYHLYEDYEIINYQTIEEHEEQLKQDEELLKNLPF